MLKYLYCRNWFQVDAKAMLSIFPPGKLCMKAAAETAGHFSPIFNSMPCLVSLKAIHMTKSFIVTRLASNIDNSHRKCLQLYLRKELTCPVSNGNVSYRNATIIQCLQEKPNQDRAVETKVWLSQ